MAGPTIDLATFDELKETAGAEFVVELVDTFLTEAPLMLDDLRRALAGCNADQFRRAAAYVSRGIGTIGIPARVGAPPEIAVLRLRKA